MTTPLAPHAPRPVALVTGASRGIGRAVALGLAGVGHDVLVNFRADEAAASAVVEACHARGGRAEACRADIALAEDRERLVDTTLAAFGRIDLLVNNAGVAPDVRLDLLDEDEAALSASFDRLIAIDLKAPYFLTRRVARAMIALRPRLGEGYRPRIVTISSVSAFAASVNRGDYCVAKAGLGMMTKLFAARLADEGIGVYELRPGVIATDMTAPVKERYDRRIAEGLTPIRRWGQPEDVAAAVNALATGALPFSTGEVINIDGGLHLHRL
jgi:NAD(P)-dependent dehydrogenase (short-subunit alcohol dehydrogenase family)